MNPIIKAFDLIHNFSRAADTSLQESNLGSRDFHTITYQLAQLGLEDPAVLSVSMLYDAFHDKQFNYAVIQDNFDHETSQDLIEIMSDTNVPHSDDIFSATTGSPITRVIRLAVKLDQLQNGIVRDEHLDHAYEVCEALSGIYEPLDMNLANMKRYRNR